MLPCAGEGLALERSTAEPNPCIVPGQTLSSVGFCHVNRAPALGTATQIKVCRGAGHTSGAGAHARGWGRHAVTLAAPRAVLGRCDAHLCLHPDVTPPPRGQWCLLGALIPVHDDFLASQVPPWGLQFEPGGELVIPASGRSRDRRGEKEGSPASHLTTSHPMKGASTRPPPPLAGSSVL